MGPSHFHGEYFFDSETYVALINVLMADLNYFPF